MHVVNVTDLNETRTQRFSLEINDYSSCSFEKASSRRSSCWCTTLWTSNSWLRGWRFDSERSADS